MDDPTITAGDTTSDTTCEHVASGTNSDRVTECHDTTTPLDAVGADAPAARHLAPPHGHSPLGAHVREVDPASTDPTVLRVDLADPSLAFIAATVDDLEGARKALGNRIRILTTLDADSDGVVRGFGLPDADPGVQAARQLREFVEANEREAVKLLEKRMKAHPIGPWVLAYPGIGAKTIGRVLGLIGDPAWHPVKGRPRMFGELKSYCGLAPVNGASPKRTRGQQASWNSQARVRLFCAVEPSIKNRNARLRGVYDTVRAEVADRSHATDCAKCGHQPAGSPWKPSHQHGHAVHMMMVTLLRDLWLEARRLHGWDDLPIPDGGTRPSDSTTWSAAVGPNPQGVTASVVPAHEHDALGHTSAVAA
jgi:hypothetical protein